MRAQLLLYLCAALFQDRGRVAEGLRADLLLVKGDATSNIRALHGMRVFGLGESVIYLKTRAETHSSFRHPTVTVADQTAKQHPREQAKQ